MLARLAALLRWLAEDADQPWRDATRAERAAENARRHKTGRRELGRR